MTETILSFLEDEVTRYLVPDIERLNTVRPQGPGGTGACAIPAAMLLFAITDLFGYLVRDETRKPKLEDTKGNLAAIFAHQIAGFSAEYGDRVDTMVRPFRHGLMYQVFPKAAGIRKPGNTDNLFERFDNLDHLNVDRFSADVLAMIAHFRQNLPAPEWTDLRKRMSERLGRMAHSDHREMKLKRAAEQRHSADDASHS
jgi:hypothetical protein